MKTIEISDKDYEMLMEMSKELQTQENDSQAFPYFWGPRSTKQVIGTDDDTGVVYDSDAADTFSLEDFADCNEDIFAIFLSNEDLPSSTEYEEIDELDWQNWVETYPHVRIVYQRDEQVSEHNFSLFKSDVKNFISGNRHHLGGDPHTYARTIWRMNKMEKLVQIIYGLNKQPKEDVNHEASRYVFVEED